MKVFLTKTGKIFAIYDDDSTPDSLHPSLETRLAAASEVGADDEGALVFKTPEPTTTGRKSATAGKA